MKFLVILVPFLHLTVLGHAAFVLDNLSTQQIDGAGNIGNNGYNGGSLIGSHNGYNGGSLIGSQGAGAYGNNGYNGGSLTGSQAIAGAGAGAGAYGNNGYNGGSLTGSSPLYTNGYGQNGFGRPTIVGDFTNGFYGHPTSVGGVHGNNGVFGKTLVKA